MDDSVKYYLNKFYDTLYTNAELEEKLRNKSLIITFLENTKNTIYKLMSDSSKSSAKIPTNVLNSLLAEGLIQNTDEIDTYTITAKGVWMVENERGTLDEKSLISYINDRYFVYSNRKPLTEKEKVILFSMIAARTFSKDSSIDLKEDYDGKLADTWKEIIDESCEKLLELSVISKKTKDTFYGKSGNEHVVSGLFRRNNDLPRKTKGIYTAPGTRKYYLDLYNNSKLSDEKLSYLFWQIFNGKLSETSRKEVINFCNKISNNKSIFIFDMSKHIFSMPKYDTVIKDCLIDSILSKRKWEIRA
ncbi:hypothetical protein B6V01_003180 [Methanosarcinales archaeon ex4572_44]|nr:MAG: hypothetical protein B6V01_003180 [Methanosarcinales archaeon ex4572_44]